MYIHLIVQGFQVYSLACFFEKKKENSSVEDIVVLFHLSNVSSSYCFVVCLKLPVLFFFRIVFRILYCSVFFSFVLVFVCFFFVAVVCTFIRSYKGSLYHLFVSQLMVYVTFPLLAFCLCVCLSVSVCLI